MTVATSSVSAAEDTLDTVDNPDDDPIEALQQQVATHPEANCAAFTTCSLSDTRELYVATGAESLSDSPEKFYQITSDTGFAAYDPEWSENNQVRYWHDGTVYERKVPLTRNRIQIQEASEPQKVRDQLIPTSKQSEGGEN